MKPNLQGTTSMFHVPTADASLAWERRNVPHGAVHHQVYDSAICREPRDLYVYTPLGYGDSGVLFNRELRLKSFELLRESMTQEIIPLVEKAYRVNPERSHRALAGLFLDGAETLFIGLNRLVEGLLDCLREGR